MYTLTKITLILIVFFIPVRRDLRSVVSFRFNSWGISKDESGVEEMSVGPRGLEVTPSETLVVGTEFCVAPSETVIPVRTGTIGGVAPSESGISSTESSSSILGTISGILSSDSNLFESVSF